MCGGMGGGFKCVVGWVVDVAGCMSLVCTSRFSVDRGSSGPDVPRPERAQD